MNVIRAAFFVVVAALALAFGQTTRASSYSSEITDFWWNSNESGWGINVTLQNDTAYATFFVYDAAGNPTWYSVALIWQGNYVWSGSLYAIRGPWFGGPFNPANVGSRAVGNATFTLHDLGNATLAYTVDGVPVVKNVTRTTWKNENLSGTFAGGFSVRFSGCFPTNLNGVSEDVGLMSVSHSGTSVTLSLYATATGDNCSFAGSYSQAGKLGQIDGTYTCIDGTHGSFTAYEITPTINGFTGAVRGTNQYCTQWTGYFGGIRRAQ